MDEELIRHMQNWARQYPGMSLEELYKIYQRQMGVPQQEKSWSFEELRDFYQGRNPATRRGTWDPAYDSLPQKYPALPEKNRSPSKSVMDMLAEQLGKPMAPGVETGQYGPRIDPRVAKKFTM